MQPRALEGCSVAPRSYFGLVVRVEEPDLVIVRAEKNAAERATRLAQVQVVKPGKGFAEKMLRARMRGEEARRNQPKRRARR